MTKQVAPDEIQYHIELSKNVIAGAEYVLLPGDPHRVESLAKAFDADAKHLKSNREYTSYLADFHKQKILVCSTGIGAPSTAIAIEELANIGLKYFLRVGTSGTIQPNINLGDVVINSASVRLEGTSIDYAPIQYPAVASCEFTNSMIIGAKKANVPFHIGINASTDTFWPAQERYDNYSGYLLRRLRNSMEEWRALNVLNFEMEASALFTICSVFGLHAACICGIIARRVESEKIAIGIKKTIAKQNWEKVAREGIYADLVRRGLIK